MPLHIYFNFVVCEYAYSGSQVTLEIQLQLITEIYQWLIVMKTHASPSTTNLSKLNKSRSCTKRTVLINSTAFMKTKSVATTAKYSSGYTFLSISFVHQRHDNHKLVTYRKQIGDNSLVSESYSISVYMGLISRRECGWVSNYRQPHSPSLQN